jgi:hypothetical protein
MAIRNPKRNDMTKCPHLFQLLLNLASDNGLAIKPDWCWPSSIIKDLPRLEAYAAELTPEEAITLTCGEGSEMRHIVEVHACHRLDDFLEEAFDGAFFNNFFLV